MDVYPSDVFIALHDWNVRRRMEADFRSETNPYGPASDVERRKEDALFALLSDRRYRSALDGGCAAGNLARRVAPLCDRLLAMDISETAVWRAMVNLADAPNVTFACRNLRTAEAPGAFDLILLSDVLPFLDAGPRFDAALHAFGARMANALAPDGRLVLISEIDSSGTYGAARRHETAFRAVSGLLFRQSLVTGGGAGPRHALVLFQQAAAAAKPATPVRGIPFGKPGLTQSSSR